MARSRGTSRAAPRPSAAPAEPNLLDLPCALLEVILLLLPLKLRVRFGMICRTARQLVGSSPVLFPVVYDMTRSRKQSLALLRWLGSRSCGSRELFITLLVQQVPCTRQLHQALRMQAARLEHIIIGMDDSRIELSGSWLACLHQLRALELMGCSIFLGSDCGQLPALQQLGVSCGFKQPHADPDRWTIRIMRPNTVIVQPGAIPPSVTSICFHGCSMPELPAALCAATGLRQLDLMACSVDWYAGHRQAPPLNPTLSSLTGLEALQLRHLTLEGQDVAALLWHLTGLQSLELDDSGCSPGQSQALCSGLPQLSALTSLRLAGECWAGNLQEPGQLRALLELYAVLEPSSSDQRLPLLASTPRLENLVVCASSLLCDYNLQLLDDLSHLWLISVMLPPGDRLRDQLAAGGSQRLVDGLKSLPALEKVFLVFADEQMAGDPCFKSIQSGLEQAGVDVFAVMFDDAPDLSVVVI